MNRITMRSCVKCEREFEVDPYHPSQEYCWDCINASDEIALEEAFKSLEINCPFCDEKIVSDVVSTIEEVNGQWQCNNDHNFILKYISDTTKIQYHLYRESKKDGKRWISSFHNHDLAVVALQGLQKDQPENQFFLVKHISV